jgi:asparagine synthase (glutamine-hydrolysing)
MSGIFGIYHLTGEPIQPKQLEAMSDWLAHRGSDAVNLWFDKSVGLGHRMLWTTPESLTEQLPLSNRSGDFVITADARIDNREELIAKLGFQGISPTEIADSRLILAAYEKWGKYCPSHLLGDFAFVIWDKRRRQVFCARDPMGVRPLYYYQSQQLFAFASEIKALLCLPQVPQRLNELKVAEYLVRVAHDKANTFYQDIHRLPGAHSLSVGYRHSNYQQYWQWDMHRDIRLNSTREYAEAYRELLTQAVACRTRSAFPVGSMLSGGLDSSSIACIANPMMQAKGSNLHTFSAIFPGLPQEDLARVDERFFIDAVLAKGGFIPHNVHADELSPLFERDRIAWHMDEAFAAPNLYMYWALCQKAQQNQVRIILDGIDGDNTVSHGQAYLFDLAKAFKVRSFLWQAKAYARQYHLPLREVAWKWTIQPLIPDSLENFWKTVQGNGHPDWSVYAVNPQFAKRIQLSQHLKAVERKDSVPAYSAREAHWNGLNSGLIQYCLEIADKAAAAFSLSPAYPFCDRRLMEFCLAIPAEQKFSDGWTRLIARRGMDGILPPEVQTRICKGFLGVNFKRRLLQWESHTLNETIFNQSQILEPFFSIPKLHEVYEAYRRDHTSEVNSLTILNALDLAYWLNRTGISK